jgi:hypothetical protein
MENVSDYGAQRVAADEQAIGNPPAGFDSLPSPRLINIKERRRK